MNSHILIKFVFLFPTKCYVKRPFVFSGEHLTLLGAGSFIVCLISPVYCCSQGNSVIPQNRLVLMTGDPITKIYKIENRFACLLAFCFSGALRDPRHYFLSADIRVYSVAAQPGSLIFPG